MVPLSCQRKSGVAMISKTKLLLLGTVFSLGATSLSLAADLPRKAPVAAPVYPPPVATWAGCYLGGAVGAVNNRVSGSVDFEGFSTSASGNKTGAIYGGYLGCNLQNGNFVYGIEGDFSGIGGSGASRGFIGVGSTNVATSKVEWVEVEPGIQGLWISGAPHVVFFFPETSPRLAGNVLVWATDRRTFRLEGRGLNRDDALRLAREIMGTPSD